MPYDDNGPIEPLDTILYAFIHLLPLLLGVVTVGYILYILIMTLICLVDRPHHKR